MRIGDSYLGDYVRTGTFCEDCYVRNADYYVRTVMSGQVTVMSGQVTVI